MFYLLSNRLPATLRPASGPWKALPALALLLAAGPARAQQPAPVADSLREVKARFAHYARRTPVEKLYAHLDRPTYLAGETLWLRLYAVDGASLRPLPASTVAYVEVLAASGQPVAQASVALRHAAGQAALELPASLPTGRYTLRAYTRYMRNFGPEYFFRTTFAVLSPRPAATVAAPAGYEARFYPEGGYLLAGVAGRVGVAATDAAGRGAALSGTVTDAAGRAVAEFSTDADGLGSFALTPAPDGAAYRAVLRLPGGRSLTRPLPAVQAQGYGLHVEPTATGALRVRVTAQLPAGAGQLQLLAHARHQLLLSAVLPAQASQAELLLPREQLAAGVVHLTLFDGRQPVCERLVFRAPTDTLALTAQADQLQPATRAAVALRLAAAGAARPVSASVAVYQLDSLNATAGAADIGSYLWLAADLPGPVAHPARYLRPGPEAAAAADNLMLTQGWSRFSWPAVLSGRADSLAYAPELNGPLLDGRLVDSRSGQPAGGRAVYLATPGRRVQLYAARSRANGRFAVPLPDLPPGPHLLVAQPDLRTDSLSRVELLSPFAAPDAPRLPGPAGSWPAARLAALRGRYQQAEVRRQFPVAGPVVPPAPVDTSAFYGKPTESYLLDKYTRFKVMEEVMREYVPGVLVRHNREGFRFLVPDYQNVTTHDDPLVLLDGVPVFDVNRIMAFDPLKVRQLDVLTSRYFLGPTLHNGLVSYRTYKGDLAGFEPDARALLQEYEGVQAGREFYAPRYDTPAAARSRYPDFRNLLYWNPAVTLAPGQATTLRFFTSDQPGRYRVVVQGLGDDGRVGSTSTVLDVKPAL